jgi:hypothetical protein
MDQVVGEQDRLERTGSVAALFARQAAECGDDLKTK